MKIDKDPDPNKMKNVGPLKHMEHNYKTFGIYCDMEFDQYCSVLASTDIAVLACSHKTSPLNVCHKERTVRMSAGGYF